MPKIAIVLFLLEIFSNMALPISIFSMEEMSNTLSISSTIPSSPLLVPTEVVSVQINSSEGLLRNIFLLSSLLSLIIGTVVGLAQTQIKRLLAYSTVSHVGFLLLALAIKTEESTESLLFYLIQYTITNLNTFFIILAFGAIINSIVSEGQGSEVKSDIRYISELKKQFLNNPILSLSFAICLFSMAGIVKE